MNCEIFCCWKTFSANMKWI